MRQIRLTDKRLKIVKEELKYAAALGSSGTQQLNALNDENNLKEGYIGLVIVSDFRDEKGRFNLTREMYLYQTSGSMISAHHSSKWSVRFNDRKNGYDKEIATATAKWLLQKGIITEEEAKKDYNYCR